MPGVGNETEPSEGPSHGPVDANQAVAVVGLACRFPGANNPSEFWQLLRAGGDAIAAAPRDRESLTKNLGRRAAAPAGRHGGFLDRVDGFDAAFFGISPREAAAMDPQQRLALELVWEALENAAIVPARLRESRTGVFFGAIADDYAALAGAIGPSIFTAHTTTGLHRGLIANRVSYALALRGPSLVVDTAQSSSLVAVHLASQSLRGGESGLAVAGGVHLNLAPDRAAALERFGGLSPDDRCFTFDARANGYVRGEGGGVVVLKLLRNALDDGDVIHCVLRGGAVNSDGSTDTLTTPSTVAQELLLAEAYEAARTSPAAVQYVELHGSGTRVGDPVEAAALGAVLGRARVSEGPLPVGSVKTNIGHLEGAAGIAGFIKMVLCIRERELVPSLNFRVPNPRIPLDVLNLDVRTDAAGPWPRPDQPLVVGVSSFGMGGTNCHVVLSDYSGGHRPGAVDPRRDRGRDRGRVETPAPAIPLPWVLSARGAAALRAQAAGLRDRLARDPNADLAGIGRSLAVTRSVFEHRAVVIAETRSGFLDGLDVVASGGSSPAVVRGVWVGAPARVVFVFPGQGSQWPLMAEPLLATSAVFVRKIVECDAALRPYLSWSVVDVLRAAPGAPPLERDAVIQPVLWAVMVALAELWRSAGVQPDAVVGHSQGEIAAVAAIGGLSLPDAARVVATRSRLLAAIAGRGGMLSLALPAERVARDLVGRHPGASLAAENGPSSTVIAGAPAALDAVVAAYGSQVRTRRIPVDYASHSADVEVIEESLLGALGDVSPAHSQVPFQSTVTGGPLGTAALDARYWYRNLREPVRFAPVITGLLRAGHEAFIEVSPHPILTTGVQDAIEASDARAGVVATLRRDAGDARRFLLALAEAFVSGVAVDWASQFPSDVPRVDLPTYAFQRRSYWLSDLPAATAAGAPGEESAAAEENAAGEETVGTAGPERPEPGADTESSVLAARLLALPPSAADRALTEIVRAQVAAVMGYGSADSIEPRHTFRDLGLDSAMMVELRNRLVGATGIALPSSALYDHPGPAALARALRERLGDGPGGPAVGDSGELAAVEPPGARALAELDRLEVLLRAVSGDDSRREQLAARLGGLAAALGQAPAPAGGGDLATEVADASVDELLALIDRTLPSA